MPVNGDIREHCKGSGQTINSPIAIIFGVGRCPFCDGLVTVEEDGTAVEHTVRVIDT